MCVWTSPYSLFSEHKTWNFSLLIWVKIKHKCSYNTNAKENMILILSCYYSKYSTKWGSLRIVMLRKNSDSERLVRPLFLTVLLKWTVYKYVRIELTGHILKSFIEPDPTNTDDFHIPKHKHIYSIRLSLKNQEMAKYCSKFILVLCIIHMNRNKILIKKTNKQNCSTSGFDKNSKQGKR